MNNEQCLARLFPAPPSLLITHCSLFIVNMLYHNLLILYRNVKRFKSTFLINLIGLSTGLTCTLLIYLWVMDEWRVDKFLENDERIFQVMQNTQGMNGVETMEATPGLLAKTLKDEIPEVDYSVAVVPPSFNISQGIVSF